MGFAPFTVGLIRSFKGLLMAYGLGGLQELVGWFSES